MSRNRTFQPNSGSASGTYSTFLVRSLRGFAAIAVLSCSLGQSCDIGPVVPGSGDQVLGWHPERPNTDDNGHEDSSSLPVVLTSGDSTVYEGQEVILDGSLSYDPQGQGLSFDWQQDGEPAVELLDANTAIAHFIAPIINVETTLTFRLTVNNDFGASTQTVYILVINAPATPEQVTINASVVGGYAPLSVDFSATAPSGQSLPEGTYNWNFGDEVTAEGQQVNHVFNTAGIYTVVLCTAVGGTLPMTGCDEQTITVSGEANDTSKPAGNRSTLSSTYIISGYVLEGTTPLYGGSVTANNNGGSAPIDGNGFYLLVVPRNWSGTVVPVKNGHQFTPLARAYSAIKLDQINQDFIADTVSVPPPPPPPENIVPIIIQGGTGALTATQNIAAALQLSASDTDAPASSLVWTIQTAAAHGSATIASGSPSSSGSQITVQYQPASDYSGFDAFVVQVSDGQGGTDDITINVTVSAPASTSAPTVVGTYYVDTNNPAATDTGAGTQAQPFKTIQKAVNTAVAGYEVIIKAGTYQSGSTTASVPVVSIPLTKSGTADKPITFKAAPGESVVLDGRGITTTLIAVRGRYINIEGLELKEAKRHAISVIDDNQNGIVDAHHVNVRLCYAHHNNRELYTGGAFRTVGPVEHVIFEDCMAHDNSIGFEFREHPTQSRDTMSIPPIAGNIGHTVDLPESQWDSWPGWVGYAARYCVVRRSISFDNRLIEGNSDGVACRYAIECIFEDNIAYGNVDDNFDLLGATRCIARGNIGFDGDPENTPTGNGNGLKMGVRGGLDNVVHHNIMFENRDGGIDMTDTERAKVYNNTCFKNLGSFGILFEGRRATAGGHTALNNICKGHPSGDIAKHDFARITLSDYNCVSDNNTRFPIPKGTHGLIATDPQFTNETLVINKTFPAGLTIPQKWTFLRDQVKAKLTLATDSPCLDTAATINGITGGALGEGLDRGALESR